MFLEYVDALVFEEYSFFMREDGREELPI